MKKPSNVRTCGWIALMYVTMRPADCDSPPASTRCGSIPSSMSTPSVPRTAAPA
jgi:hypothetical protein